MKRLLLIAALALCPSLVHAQSSALTKTLDHLQASPTAFGLTTVDLDEVAVTDEYASRNNGVTHIYLRQRVNGVEVYNARASAHVTPAGRVVGVKSAFIPNASRAANAPTPSLTAEAAVAVAARHLGLAITGAPSVIESTDDRHRMLLGDGGVSLSPIPVELVYFATEDGVLRLAWDLSIEQRDAQHWWSLRVDAATGAVLDQTDWVTRTQWYLGDASTRDIRPIPSGDSWRGGAYNVWAYPVESPIHGERSLVAGPVAPTASPLGWHDDGSTQYTITRGNNVYAYEDRAQMNVPGYSPDGGEALVFDFEIDLDTQQPPEYEDVSITNLFYWTNFLHDVLARYGFDEAAGNFQQTNFSGEGLGGDYLRAEAQDNTNTTVLSTPPDGARPRMQLSVWGGGTPLTLTSPESIAGAYATGEAQFGEPFSSDFPETAIVPVLSADGGDYPGGEPDLDLADRACEEILNAGEVAGKIALIERGGCPFALKVWNAQQAGAIAAIIHSNSRNGPGETGSPEDLVNMTATQSDLPFDLDDLMIPSVFVAQSTGAAIFENQPALGFIRGVLDRDAALDAGIIAYEVGQAAASRLTGGPASAGCLSNQEQMGTGWGDWYALMMTMQEGDDGATGREIGSYLVGNEPGGGIRPYPYSTSLAINPHTYGDIQTETVPQGVGAVWGAMLWEVTWGLIDEEGFDGDLIDGTAGNSVALALVTEGMKLQPCTPGFVDGRDAILMADTLTYDGAYSDVLWRAFAKRGLGFSADQGSSNSVSDGTEAFDLPPGVPPVANEGEAVPGMFVLTAAYPNPFAERARFALEVAEAQDVRVTVYDVMGREIIRLHDGSLAAGTRHGFEVDGRALSSGVYLVRVDGEHFTETHRLTVLR